MEEGEYSNTITLYVFLVLPSSVPIVPGLSNVSLDTFIKFLVLCESNGYIELKLSVEELRDKVGCCMCVASIWLSM